MPIREVPDEEMVAFFISRMNGHKRVASIHHTSTQLFEFITDRGVKILVFLSDLYTIGLADYFDIRGREADVSCIVTASGYNSYTKEAKERARQDHVGLFKIGELMGALHLADYWNYEPPEKDNESRDIRQWRA